jgi:hypothetical protein
MPIVRDEDYGRCGAPRHPNASHQIERILRSREETSAQGRVGTNLSGTVQEIVL